MFNVVTILNMLSKDHGATLTRLLPPFRVSRACGIIVSYFITAVLARADGVSAEDPVTIEPQENSLIVKIHGEEFTVLRHGSSLAKPFFWPVRAADGAILTRPIEPQEKDHPHHRGIWLAVDEVNEIKFWAERGKIETRKIEAVGGDPAKIQLQNEWIGLNGKPTIIESTTISIHSNRLITYDFTLAPPVGQLVRFDDTKEGFFGIRIAQSMRELEGGVVTNSDGNKTTKECWGQTAKWVDYTGSVDGKHYGVVLMDHPGNFRPSRFHVRDYGLFSLSPFGEGAYQNDALLAKPVILDDATPLLRMRYGLYVHNDQNAVTHINLAYKQFLETTADNKSQ